MKTLKVNCDSEGIKSAVQAVKNGKIVVFPTDTVYGVGCDPYNQNAIKLLYQIKNRDTAKLFPILGFSKNELSKIAFFDKKANMIAEKFWPGEITLVLKLKDEKLKKTLKLDEKIAVRVPNNACILSILKKCKLIVGTSANVSGSKPFKNSKECIKNFTGYDLFVDGGIIHSKGESTVVEVDNDIRVLREGTISKDDIEELF